MTAVCATGQQQIFHRFMMCSGFDLHGFGQNGQNAWPDVAVVVELPAKGPAARHYGARGYRGFTAGLGLAAARTRPHRVKGAPSNVRIFTLRFRCEACGTEGIDASRDG